MVKHTQTIRRQQQTNCFSVFVTVWGWRLSGKPIPSNCFLSTPPEDINKPLVHIYIGLIWIKHIYIYIYNHYHSRKCAIIAKNSFLDQSFANKMFLKKFFQKQSVSWMCSVKKLFLKFSQD